MIHTKPLSLFRLRNAGYARVTSLAVIASFLLATLFPYMPLSVSAQQVDGAAPQETESAASDADTSSEDTANDTAAESASESDTSDDTASEEEQADETPSDEDAAAAGDDDAAAEEENQNDDSGETPSEEGANETEGVNEEENAQQEQQEDDTQEEGTQEQKGGALRSFIQALIPGDDSVTFHETHATVVARKIVCENESDLPNWGNGGADIDSTTAEEWVEDHPGCTLEDDWSFEWKTEGDQSNPGGSTIGAAGGDWHTFTADGEMAIVNLPVDGVDLIQMREVLPDGYVPFTDDINDDISAEFYCASDVSGYDNWEWIENPDAGTTYHCVGFNVPEETPEDDITLHTQKIVCDDESDLPNWGAGNVVTSINADTAADWLADNAGKGCQLVDWEFQWVDNALASTNPGDHVEVAGGQWSDPFSDSMIINVEDIDRIWVREVASADHIAFGGQSTTASTSAEMYCGTDVLHYDNWESIDIPEEHADDYYCVAWNVPEDGGEQEDPFCPLQPMEGRTIIDLGDGVIRSDQTATAAQKGPFDVNIPAGTYDVTLVSYDDHDDKPGQFQPNEQWYLKLFGIGGTQTGMTSTIADLPSDQNYLTQLVNEDFAIASSVDEVIAQHSAYPVRNANSVVPVCAAFDRVGTTTTPGEECRIEVVSEAGDEGVGNGNAVLAFIHSGWTTALNTVASWIWDTQFVQNPTIDEEKTFTKDFFVDTEVNDATLRFAADNRYSIEINGTEVAADNDELNYGSVTTLNLATSTIEQGWNTITLTVENIGVPGSTAQDNPAAGIYQLVINGDAQEDCEMPPPGDDDDFVKVHIFKHLTNGTTTTQVPDDSTLAPFPMRASWNASNLGSGTGDYVLGNGHGGASFDFAADTSDMATPVTSYTTFERTTAIDSGSQVLPAGAQCEPDMFRLVGYKYGTSLAAAQAAPATTTAPVFENFSNDQYVIVVNEDCDDVLGDDEEGSITIVKQVTGTTTTETFDFDADWLGVGTTTSIDFSLAAGASTTFTGLATGTYAVHEVFGTSTDWELESVSCRSIDAATLANSIDATEITYGVSIVLDEGEDVICTFTNTLDDDTTPGGSGNATTTGTLIVTKTVVNDSGTGSATTSDFTLQVVGNGATTTVNSGIAGAFATGTYSVIETGPGGYAGTFGGDCNAQGQVTIAAGATSTCTLVNDDLPRLPGTTEISGTKWNDLDDDGVRDFGEPGVSGVTISITNDATTTPFATTTVTDSDGSYSFFNLAVDDYFICESVQNGWSQTYPSNGSAPFTDCQGSFGHATTTSLTASTTGLDFGNHQENQCIVTIVSDTNTTVDQQGNSAADLVSFIHPGWTAVIDDASWIWGDDPVADPSATTTYTFTRTFNWNGPVTGATLDIASDNAYSVTLNGVGVGTSTDGNNFAAGTQDTFDISDEIVQGTNTLKITVTNFALAGATDPESNPAGLMYRLSSTGSNENCGELPTVITGDDDDDNGGGGGGGRSSSRRRSSNNDNDNDNDDDDDDDGEVLGATFDNDDDLGNVLGSFFPGFPNTGEGGTTAKTLSSIFLVLMLMAIAAASVRAFKRT